MATGLRYKGTLTVFVDPSRLEAKLALSREGDLEYDEGAVVRILSDAGVTSGFAIDELVASIQSFQKSKQEFSEIVAAKGEAPRAPVGESWEWVELPPLTGEQATLAARIAKSAGAPEVFQVRTEKVKVQKRVAAKAGLFGAATEEVQTVIEAREIREKVLVDPTVVQTAWVEAGSRVATVYPPQPGQPGKDLAGKPLPAPAAKAPPFFLGAHLVRQKAEVTAKVSGFLRLGRNWADIASHRDHRWEVTYSADRTSAYLTFEPGDSTAAQPAAAPLLARLKADGFDTSRVPSEDELNRLLEGAWKSSHTLSAHSLVADRDGSFEIRLSADRSRAVLDLHKALGAGTPFSLKDLGAALKEAQLKGFSFDKLKDTIVAFLNGPETEKTDLLLAQGQPPTRGKDLILVYTIGFLADADLKALQMSLNASPKLLEGVPDRQRLPVDKVERAGPVRADEQFARLESPEDGLGEDGIDVTGQKIPAIPGNEPPLVLLTNVRKAGNSLVSAIDGLLELATLDGATVLRVRPHLDAVAAVRRSDDNLAAYLTLVQGRGTGRRLDRALVDAALAAAQVTHGVDQLRVASALETALAAGKVEDQLVALGTPAGNDLSRRLAFAQPQRVDAEGKRRSPIRVGEVAATYRPATDGQVDGVDVLGNPIPSPDMEVRNLIISQDLAVEPDDQGQQVLRALKGGDLVFDGESLSILTEATVASVGGKAPNVKFFGDVTVAGAVETGAYVLAGNLKVRGRVGGALLSSDHNIQVADGIHGEGKAVLRAKRHVSVGFVERALVMAVGDVHVGKAALGCTFRVNGKIYQKTTGGGVQGGTAKVRLGLDVMNLGSPSGVSTAISFGQDYLIEDQIKAEVKETDKLREAIVALDVLMRKLAGPADRDKLASARQKKVLMMKLLEKRNLKLINLRDKFELHVPSEIVVRETLYPGVSVESHGRVYEPQAKRTAVRLVFNEQTGHIEEFPLD